MVRNSHLEGRSAQLSCPPTLAQASLAAMERQVDEALLAKPESVWVDLAAVQAVESAGLEWLIVVQSRLAAQGIQLVLKRPSKLMSDVLIATRLDSRFRIDSPEQEASHA